MLLILLAAPWWDARRLQAVVDRTYFWHVPMPPDQTTEQEEQLFPVAFVPTVDMFMECCF
jgi:hypothetical protein